MGKRLTLNEFIERSNKIHYGKYDYSNVIYGGCFQKIKINCPLHGEFIQSPSIHLRGMGCQICGNNKRYTFETFVEKSKIIHNNRYNYSYVIYKNCETYVKIICPLHGIFFQWPIAHLRGQGCPKCGIIKQSNSKRSNLETFIKRAVIVHGNKYDYSKVNYINNILKLEIICKTHGSFFQSSICHINLREGCPKCKSSKGELKILNFLNSNNIKYISQKTFDDCRNPNTNSKLKFDFYIPSKNLLIEFDGEQHFLINRKVGAYTSNELDLKSIQYRDNLKTKYSHNNGINILRIKYTELKLIDKILSKKLL